MHALFHATSAWTSCSCHCRQRSLRRNPVSSGLKLLRLCPFRATFRVTSSCPSTSAITPLATIRNNPPTSSLSDAWMAMRWSQTAMILSVQATFMTLWCRSATRCVHSEASASASASGESLTTKHCLAISRLTASVDSSTTTNGLFVSRKDCVSLAREANQALAVTSAVAVTTSSTTSGHPLLLRQTRFHPIPHDQRARCQVERHGNPSSGCICNTIIMSVALSASPRCFHADRLLEDDPRVLRSLAASQPNAGTSFALGHVSDCSDELFVVGLGGFKSD
jgi:hypothetical protein